MLPPLDKPIDDQLLTAAEAAGILKIHPKTVLLFARTGRLPALRIGRLWRFRKSDLTRWADVQTKQWNF